MIKRCGVSEYRAIKEFIGLKFAMEHTFQYRKPGYALWLGFLRMLVSSKASL
jgi:hypothetical protein